MVETLFQNLLVFIGGFRPPTAGSGIEQVKDFFETVQKMDGKTGRAAMVASQNQVIYLECSKKGI